MPQTPPVVLTIAGFDPSSGAGVTADIKTIAAHGCYGVSCITALTVQSTKGVRRLEPVAPGFFLETLEELSQDIEIKAVHIGMLGNGAIAKTLAAFLETRKLPRLVLDPILKSSSGADLVDALARRVILERLIPLAEIVTPNIDEASALTGMTITDSAQLPEVAARLHALGARNVVITGGHLRKATDLLSFTTARGIEQEVFSAERQQSNSTHGTGCAFATSVACHLAHDRGLPEAVLLAKAYVSAAITNAYPVGKGQGPLHHLYRMEQQRRHSVAMQEPEPTHK